MIACVCNLYTNKSTVQEMANLFGTPVLRDNQGENSATI